MSILHRRRNVKRRAIEREAAGRRRPLPHEFERASATSGKPADVKARTWVDPDAVPSTPDAPPPKSPRPRRRKPAKRSRK